MRQQGFGVGVYILLVCLLGCQRASVEVVQEETPDAGVVATLAADQILDKTSENLCAVNCLYGVCRLFRVETDYGAVKRLLAPSENGVSMLSLKRAAQTLGFQVNAEKLDTQDLQSVRVPIILYRQNLAETDGNNAIGHYLLLIPHKESGVFWVVDPPRPMTQSGIDDLTIAGAPALLLSRAN